MRGSVRRARRVHLLAIWTLAFGLAAPATADLVPGLLNDFEDGLQGWEGSGNVANIADGGPLGAGDGYLEIEPGSQGHIAAFNLGVAGAIDPDVVSVEADLMRPSGQGDLDVRFVLFGPGGFERWTSVLAHTIPADGVWRTYDFSVLETDLSHVLGSATYEDLASDLDRIMFRYDPGTPSPTGTPGTGVLNVDNVVVVVPEPSTGLLIAASLSIVIALAPPKRRDE